jgi:hypothetical protein
MVWQFIEVFKKIGGEQTRDDDFADRLSHRYTVILLLIFCILVGSSQFVGNPIQCWAPAHFSGSMTAYTNNICWIANTYYVPLADDTKLPGPNEPREYRINYYQWVPFILAFMAFLFYSPWAIWHVLSQPANLDLKSVMKIVDSMDETNAESRRKSIITIVKLIDRSIDNGRNWYSYDCVGKIRRMFNRCFIPCIYKRANSYLSTLYILIKLVYLFNVCGQFFLLNAFMGPNFNMYGFHVMRDLYIGKDFWESPRFPRVTMCDFTIRTLGENNHRNTIQCTLPINLFNEKIFMFLWFWLVLVSTLSAYSFLTWLFNFTPNSCNSFVRRYLNIGERYSNHILPLTNTNASSTPHGCIDTSLLNKFISEYLRKDGVFLLRIIKKNSNDLVVGELIAELWMNYKRTAPKYIQNNEELIDKETEKLTNDNTPNGYHA